MNISFTLHLIAISNIFLLSHGFIIIINNNNNNYYSYDSNSYLKSNTMLSATDETQTSRRKILQQSASTILSTFLINKSVNAFPNKISDKYDDRPKRRGPQPKDLYIGTRKDMFGEPYTGLKQCGPAPNCFSSTDLIDEDPEHVIPSWKWPKSINTKKDAFEQLELVIQKYKPGQANIDGGGFQIVQSDLNKGYIYVQFESLKNGYIDDFELVYMDDKENEVQVRSSSRVGYLDFGVNMKRINYIAKQMRELGWDAEGVNPDTHRDYIAQNSGA